MKRLFKSGSLSFLVSLPGTFLFQFLEQPFRRLSKMFLSLSDGVMKMYFGLIQWPISFVFADQEDHLRLNGLRILSIQTSRPNQQFNFTEFFPLIPMISSSSVRVEPQPHPLSHGGRGSSYIAEARAVFDSIKLLASFIRGWPAEGIYWFAIEAYGSYPSITNLAPIVLEVCECSISSLFCSHNVFYLAQFHNSINCPPVMLRAWPVM